jgi:DNA-binding NarL/FixJ family response regulator
MAEQTTNSNPNVETVGQTQAEAEQPINVLIADDHAVVRVGLRLFLGLDPALNVVGEATNGEEALAMAQQLHPDVILMDLLMPVMDGLTAIQKIKKSMPDVEVLALTSVLDDAQIYMAINSGAMGYLLKDTKGDVLVAAIKGAYNGEVQLSPEVAKRLVREMRPQESPEKLTEREIEVLRLITRGLSNKDIAAKLFVSEKTVKTHISNLLTKLDLPSRTQAALYALKHGIATLN